MEASSRLSSKGQVTIPSAVRRALSLEEGDRVVFRVEGDRAVGDPRRVTAFVDTNILIRHLTGDPPDQALRATRYLSAATDLLLADLILAEVAYVLESFHETPRTDVATYLRAVVGFPAIRVVDEPLLLRTIELYEVERLDFAAAYLVASADSTGVGIVASFDRSLDRVERPGETSPPDGVRAGLISPPGRPAPGRRAGSGTVATG